VLGLRHRRSLRAAETVVGLLKDPIPDLRLSTACVAAAAQDPDETIMSELSRLALNSEQGDYVRTIALEALISVQRRQAERSTATLGDSSQQQKISRLLDREIPEQLRQFAVVYLAGCATTYARQRLAEVAGHTDDPLAALAVRAAASANGQPQFPRRAGARESRGDYELLTAVVRAGVDTKDGQNGGNGGVTSPRSWPTLEDAPI
jgi:hypothetical protein